MRSNDLLAPFLFLAFIFSIGEMQSSLAFFWFARALEILSAKSPLLCEDYFSVDGDLSTSSISSL